MSIRNLALDGSFMAMRAFGSGSMARGFVSLLTDLRRDIRPALTVACWEGTGSRCQRTEWMEGYKAKRRAERKEWPERERYIDELSDLRRHLPLLGVFQADADGFEGDDAAATIARTWPGSTLLWSADHDWNQLLGQTGVWLQSPGKPLRGPCEDGDDEPRGEYALNLYTLSGCRGDEVPGLPYKTEAGETKRMGTGLAAKVLTVCPRAVEAVLSRDEAGLTALDFAIEEAGGQLKRLLQAVRDGREELEQNRRLVKLHTVPLRVVEPREDGAALEAWAEKHGMRLLLGMGSDAMPSDNATEHATEEIPW